MLIHIRNIKKITSSRTLCEYDKYIPNYDNDPEMKEVMEKYYERLAIRWKEYDELKKEKERKYKEQYDKDIKEIILKDKIEKQLTKQLSALDKFTDIDDLAKGIYEKKVATKNKKGYKKSNKTLGHTLTEWNILANIDMYEWIPFSSKEAKIDCNIKNMKHALTKVGYIGHNKFASLGNKDGKDSIDMDQLFSSIMSSSNAFIQRYMGDDITSNGNSLKKQKGLLSLGLYALWEILEHIVTPTVATLIFGVDSDKNRNGRECKKLQNCGCVCKDTKTCCCVCKCGAAKTCCCVCRCGAAEACCCVCNSCCACACEAANACCCVCRCGVAQACCCLCNCCCVCVCESAKACCCVCTCGAANTCCYANTGVVNCAMACADKCAKESSFLNRINNILEGGKVFVDAFVAVYIIASIMLILYYVLKYYRELKMGKKEKYMKILQE
ncbi:rifin PIR protein, putative [Plasmodium gaboni]|uniref:Rifin PIR protein, putative n=1 Tax=Plasmodium gaboni TaxID=647221 RepID=A0ABY0KVZ9_9APIC|nr:rifin PIR protein, putative [Plasmodium gaboni]